MSSDRVTPAPVDQPCDAFGPLADDLVRLSAERLSVEEPDVEELGLVVLADGLVRAWDGCARIDGHGMRTRALALLAGTADRDRLHVVGVWAATVDRDPQHGRRVLVVGADGTLVASVLGCDGSIGRARAQTGPTLTLGLLPSMLLAAARRTPAPRCYLCDATAGIRPFGPVSGSGRFSGIWVCGDAGLQTCDARTRGAPAAELERRGASARGWLVSAMPRQG